MLDDCGSFVRRVRWLWLISIFFASASVASDMTADGNPKDIHYLVYGSAGEPLQILNDEAAGEGLVTDVIHEIFRSSSYQLHTVIKPLRRIKREMQYGQAKRWIAYALRSWGQEGIWENATFADIDLIPYRLSLAYPEKSKFGTFNLRRLSGRQVVWLQGFKYPGALRFRDKYGFTFLRATSHQSAIKMLEADRAPYFMESAARIRFAMQQLGIEKEKYRFFPLDHEIPPTTITLLMSNDLGEHVHEFVNHRLKELQASGWLKKRAEKYGFSEFTPSAIGYSGTLSSP
ncbi:hypothetical protein KOI40_08625 [Aestuariicella sp. G3-2]|uniref:hypothetical protein n=1 Tax=Pseudomaricurvus albidus TaxID=2842452 RepID=UPI001C0BF12A|nr:hypothetical protein [Aestuariicella albida]MBU3069884.1 hypothetical protein [Aestuariicella albida]